MKLLLWLIDHPGEARALRPLLRTAWVPLQDEIFGELPDGVTIAVGLVTHAERLPGLGGAAELINDGQMHFFAMTANGFLTTFVGKHVTITKQNGRLVVSGPSNIGSA